jgi:asparagine synthase (glutamine-hydrolysing)
VGGSLFSGKIDELSLPSLNCRFAGAQVGGMRPSDDLYVDSPTMRPELLEAAFSFIRSVGAPTRETPPLFGTFVSLGPGGISVGRDPLGTRPLFVARGDTTRVCSEVTPLRETGAETIEALPPGCVFDVSRDDMAPLRGLRERSSVDEEGLRTEKLVRHLSDAIKALPSPRAVYFSGGIDSLVLAKLSEVLGDTTLICAGVEGCKDLAQAKAAAEHLGSPLEMVLLPPGDLARGIDSLRKLTLGESAMNLEIALPLLHAAARANEIGIKTAICGQGADELFGGYHRYLSDPDPGSSMKRDIAQLHSRGLVACDLASRSMGVEVFFPYVDQPLLEYGLSLALQFKIHGGVRKIALREVGIELGLPKESVAAKKSAIQYGSGVHKHLARISGGS